MSISTTATKVSYAGNNSNSTPYAITFKYLDVSHVTVYADKVDITTNCTFSGDGAAGTGQFTTDAAQAPTVTVTAVLDVPLDQPVVLQETGSLPAKTLEVSGFDRLNMQIRRVWRKATDALSFSSDEGSGSTGTADTLVGFDGSGDIAEIPNTTFCQTANNLSDVDAATARTNLNVDVAGTDNSTDVTLAGTGTYLSMGAGQVLTVDPITKSDISDLDNLTDLSDVTITNPVSGEVLEWNGSAWVNQVSGATVTASDTAPVSPDEGDLWFDSTTTQMYVYYNDGSSSQWVTVTSGSPSTDAATVTYTPAGTGAVATDVETKLRESVSVKDFGAVGDGVTDDTAAIQAALDTGGSVYFPEGDYFITAQLNCSGSMRGDGIGLSRLIFDQSVIASNGVYFFKDQEREELVIEGFSILCKGGNGLSAISCEKGQYFTGPYKLKISSVSVADYDGPDHNIAGFLTVNTWSVGLDCGDLQGLDVTDFYVYSNYDITQVDGSNNTSIGIKLDSSDTLLFPKFSGVWINACRTGISLEDKCFGFFSNIDITRSWIGFEAITADNFNELFLDNVAVNAQKYGFHFNGYVRLYLNNSFANRHKDGVDQGHIWYGYILNTITKSFIANAHSQPDALVPTPAVTDQVGFNIVNSGDLMISSLIAGANLDKSVQLNNCSSIKGSIMQASTTGTVLDLLNNTRAVDLSLTSGESFTGVWYAEDGTLDLRNIKLDIIESTTYSLVGKTKFLEGLAISDKDNVGVTDEGFSIVCENGQLRVKTIDSGTETNAILIDRSGTSITEIDLRTPRVTIQNGPSWLVGSGSPEGVHAANVGSFYSRTDGAAGTAFYVKESGTGNTGWVAK